RLEGMTKIFQVPIVLDEATATRVQTPASATWCRCRRLARVQPFGMDRVVTVSELLPPPVYGQTLSEADRKDYEAALNFFLRGRWKDALRLLEPLGQDGPAQVLRQFMTEHQQIPPPGWNGVIGLKQKGE